MDEHEIENELIIRLQNAKTKLANSPSTAIKMRFTDDELGTLLDALYEAVD